MAVLAFVVAGVVRWPRTLPMLAGGIIGGFLGARFARWLPGGTVRTVTLGAAAAIPCVFFARAYFR